MASGYTNQSLIKDFKNRCVPVIKQAAEYILSEQKKDIHSIFSSAGEAVEHTEKLTKSFETLVRLKHSPQKDLDRIWLDAIEDAVSDLPELVVLPQEEKHFRYKEGDTPYAGAAVILKRVKRTVEKASLSAENGLRRLAKKDEKQYRVPTRNVPFKNMVKSVLLEELLPVISGWHIDQSRFASEALTEIQFWLLDQLLKEERSAEGLTDLFTKLTGNYDARDVEYAQRLSKRLGEEIPEYLSSKVENAGTVKLPEDKFSDELTSQKKSHFAELLESHYKKWNDLLDAQATQLLVCRHLNDLRVTVGNKNEELTSVTAHFFKRCAEEPHAELQTRINQFIEEFRAAGHLPPKELETKCDTIQSFTAGIINEEIVDPVDSAAEERYISTLLEKYVSDITDISKEQPEAYVLIEDLEVSGELPKFSLKEVEWQQFIQRMLARHIASEMVPAKIRPEQELAELSLEYREIMQMVETNLDLVEEVTKKEEEAPVDIALQGLERTLVKLGEVEELVKKAKKVYPDQVKEKSNVLFSRLSELLKNQDGTEMRWAETQLKVKESAGGWRTRWMVFSAKVTDRVALLSRFTIHKYKSLSDQIREYLGLKPEVQLTGQKTDLAAFLHETDQKIEQLPFIYRRLFDFHRDVEAAFFIKDPVHFDQVKKAHGLWKGGFPASVSVIGEKGSGKSTTLRFLKEEIFSDDKTWNLSFSNTIWKPDEMREFIAKNLKLGEQQTHQELAEAIRRKRKGSVIFVENIQNCYVRNMQGYEVVKSLLHVIAETKKEVFWVVSSSRYAWNFFEVVFKISDYFSHSLQSDFLNEEEIRTLIMKRQKASGYQLRFLPDESTEKSRSYRKLLDDDEKSQEYLKEEYFEKLWEMSEGNATVAMIFWIRSIKEISETGFTIQPFDFTATERLDSLDPVSLFALSAFILHDALSPVELAMVLNSSESDCELIISRLNSRGLLVETNKYYTLNDLIYRQVVRLLKTRNILH